MAVPSDCLRQKADVVCDYERHVALIHVAYPATYGDKVIKVRDRREKISGFAVIFY